MFPRFLVKPSLHRTSTSHFLPWKLTTARLGTLRRNSAMGTTTPWHAAYPQPRNAQPDSLTAAQVLDLLHHRVPDETEAKNNRFVLVDLRRNDHQVLIPHVAWTARSQGLTILLGRCHSRFNQSPRPKSSSYHPPAVRPVPGRWGPDCHLVLWSVAPWATPFWSPHDLEALTHKVQHLPRVAVHAPRAGFTTTFRIARTAR